jgi:hypothetical protein
MIINYTHIGSLEKLDQLITRETRLDIWNKKDWGRNALG